MTLLRIKADDSIMMWKSSVPTPSPSASCFRKDFTLRAFFAINLNCSLLRQRLANSFSVAVIVGSLVCIHGTCWMGDDAIETLRFAVKGRSNKSNYHTMAAHWVAAFPTDALLAVKTSTQCVFELQSEDLFIILSVSLRTPSSSLHPCV